MSATRKSAPDKILGIIYASVKDVAGGIDTFMSYRKLRYELMHWDKESNLSKAIFDLRHHGYLEIVEKENAKLLRLTPKGKMRAWRPYIRKRWDGKWRLVAFDIPEKMHGKRDWFRNALKLMGFRYMQKSLWICPYDTSEEIERVIDILDIESYVDYYIADAITNKNKYLKMFDLNQENITL